ncbi:HU family DNA-binding protein [Fimbriiglobus ruber]|uniref:Histone-like protein n=1 Tax=Fimbriiglobus ruber TaxID=1908690 RepID=A0A225E0I8_9BACT|nr:HU family DNA-binding protein [Fimbriiglobus ruber]OWK47111.1 Histone-like protein [Fimbriiglobus ruber]
MAKATPGKAKAKKKAMTKSALYAHLAEGTGLKKTDVVTLFDKFLEVIHQELGPKGSGQFTLPGIARFKLRKVKAVKGGQKKINPLNGQEYTTKDRPAHNKVRVLPVKTLSEALK